MVRDERATPLFTYILGHTDHRGPLLPVYLRAIESLGALRDSAGIAPLKTALYKGEWWAPRRTVQLRAEVPNSELRILPGQFVRARVYIGELDGVLVPQVAVLTSDKGKAVMVVGPDNKVTRRPVEAGTWQGNQWVIRKGLEAGDKVIVDNIVKLRPGMTVAPTSSRT